MQMRTLALAVLAAPLLWGGPPQFPDTPAARQFSAWFTAFNSGDRAILRQFFEKNYPARLKDLDDEMGFRGETGGFEFQKAEESSATHFSCIVKERNSEQLARAYLTGCLSYHIEALEERFERAFEFPADYEIKFDLSALLRTEIDVRYTAYTQSLNAGWQTINEVRANEGLEPVDGGDEPHLQMQYVPLSKINDPPAPAPNPLLPAGTPKPGEEPPPAPDDSDPDTEASKSIDRARVRALLRQRLDRRAA